VGRSGWSRFALDELRLVRSVGSRTLSPIRNAGFPARWRTMASPKGGAVKGLERLRPLNTAECGPGKERCVRSRVDPMLILRCSRHRLACCDPALVDSDGNVIGWIEVTGS
jgi:hypothetical protein